MAFNLSLTGVMCKSQQLLSGPSAPFSTLTTVSPSPPFPSLFSPVLPLASHLLVLDFGPDPAAWQRCKLPHATGSGTEPQPKSNLMHYIALKSDIWWQQFQEFS